MSLTVEDTKQRERASHAPWEEVGVIVTLAPSLVYSISGKTHARNERVVFWRLRAENSGEDGGVK